MPVSAKLYLPPHVSQRRTALAADGVDDCRVIESQRLVHHATLGETCTTARGHEMSTSQLVRQAVLLRRTLDDPATTAEEDQAGPLDTSHAQRMIAAMWPRLPRIYPADIDFRELLARLEDGHCASLSGNPAHIRADSPLKRAGDVGHELGLSGIRKRAGVVELAVDDPYRHDGKHPRVEWRPATELRQFAYQDSDRDLTAVFTVRIGSWTAERLKARAKDARIAAIEADAARTEKRLRRRIAALEATTPPDGAALVANAKAAAHESAHVASIAWHQQQRSVGP